MPATLIALLTDFGTADGYVASMKGVILGILPEATLVDVTHEIAPQDVAQGAFVLGSVYRFFPADTIFVAVVDPGVGTSRRALLVVTPHGRFVAPDNGLLTYVMGQEQRPQAPIETRLFSPLEAAVPPTWKAIALSGPEYWRQPVSATFHGRDIFAPVAAHLARGVPPEELGEEVSSLTVLHVPPPVRVGETLRGLVLHVDRFGNLVTNVPAEELPQGSVRVKVGSATIEGLSATYGEGRGLVALVGSHGYVEIALVGGSAAQLLGVGVGAAVETNDR